ncbi:tetratricopeptide repeat protein [Streptomyces avidinii]|uniref:AAA family ATPase n=1 Tax=Streptomyces avidinii TaxID=1895 RepID=UPI00386C58CD|nr:tetratricopeptide repeat protein [Streptomyces avidinii]
MSETSGGIRGTALGIVVEQYEKSGLRRLTGATEQMRELCELLEGHGYTARMLTDPGWKAVREPVRDWAVDWGRGGRHGPAVVVWSGHGKLDDGELRLMLGDTENPEYEGETFSANELTATALLSRADQVLLLIDTCHAGAGVGESLKKALTKLSAKNLPPGRSAWLGVLAGCRPQEEAEADGVLLESFGRLLREGPQPDTYRHEWSRRNELISGSTVVKTLLAQWPEDLGQRPLEAMTGLDLPMFANPLRRAAPEPELVEHLVQAARGASPTDEGWFFSGRRGVLGAIVEWLAAREPGLFLVTGSAGSGKSAVLGRIATLSDREHRASIMAYRPLEEDDPDPGVGSVHVSLHLRGFTVQQLAEAIARRLNLDPPQTPAALIAEVEQGWPGAPPHLVLVLDGLDEAAPDQAHPIVEQLLAPLSRLASVLLGSRDRPFRPEGELREPLDRAVSRLLDVRARAVDLNQENNTRNDIQEYVQQRLVSRDLPAEDAATVARGIAGRAAPHTGGFLFAKMATDSVIRRLAASQGEDWDWVEVVPSSISTAFREDLRDGPKRERGGELLPRAAEDLLTALAWSQGNGLPAQGVWEAVASALSTDGVTYGPEDVDWLLNEYGRYVVEDTDGVQAVYRLYHREFIVHLVRRSEPADPAYRVVRALIDLLRTQTDDAAVIENANPYVRWGLSAHAPMAGEQGIDLIRELVKARADVFRPDLAAALSRMAVVLRAGSLREAALSSSQEATELYRTLAADKPAAYRPSLATSLNNLADRQAEAGDLNSALTTITEATDLYRTLAADNPAAHRSNLAGVLNNLAIRQAETGDLNSSLTTITEAVTIRRTLAADNPAAYRPSLAMSLNNLAIRQAEIGDRNSALTTIEEAVTIHRTLAADNPAAHRSNLAGALNNLATCQAKTGDRSGALTTITEATELYRALAADNPSAHRSNLATSLNNLANCQAEAGDLNGALTTITEATDLYRTLAMDNPTAHRSNLATSLNNLANCQAEAGDLNGALTTITEATDLYRTLAADNPAAYRPSVAMSLNNLGNRQAETGDLNGALTTITEAVTIHRTLAADNPAAYRPSLAMSLNNLGNRQAETGDLNSALTTITEGADLYRTLAMDNPAAYRPELATSLNNLAIRQAQTGDLNSALTTITEAVTIRRTLAADNPAAYRPDLATSLNNLANCQAEKGDLSNALSNITEATDLYRTLATQHPTAHLPRLAMSLNNLSLRQGGAGDLSSALSTITEATDLYRTLAADNPAAYRPDLASSLNNLAKYQVKSGDPRSALSNITEATDLYLSLAGQHPAAYRSNLTLTLNNLARLAPPHEAVAAYSAAEELLRAYPQASRSLGVQRAQVELTGIDTNLGIRSLIALSHPQQVPGTPDPAAFEARLRLRAYHHRADTAHASQVAALWREETGTEPPPWLALTQAALDLATQWISCPTWAHSQDFWHAHADTLRSDMTVSALRELALATESAEVHLQILRVAEEADACTAFRPYLTGELLHAWMGLPNWAESQSYLTDHQAELLQEQARILLGSQSESPRSLVHVALVSLARADGIPTAYAYVADRSDLRRRIEELLAAPEVAPELLQASALLELCVHHGEFTGTAYNALAVALTDTPTDPPTTWPPAGPGERDRVMSEIAALIGRHPRHAAALGALLQSLLAG